MKKCPVSGKRVQENKRTPMVECEGEVYYFCCPSHKDVFSADPRKFIEGGPIQLDEERYSLEVLDLFSEADDPEPEPINENLNIGFLRVPVHLLTLKGDGKGKVVGYIDLEDTDLGLVLTPGIHFPPLKMGQRGFHLHENGDLRPGLKDGKKSRAVKAGAHYDPHKTDTHQGPYGNGHLGDLPPLFFDEQGVATTPVSAPRLTLADAMGRSLIIHVGGDNFTDDPPNGGGRARILGAIVE